MNVCSDLCDQGTIHCLVQQSIIKSIQTLNGNLADDNVLCSMSLRHGKPVYIDLRRNSRRAMVVKRTWLVAAPCTLATSIPSRQTIQTDRSLSNPKMWICSCQEIHAKRNSYNSTNGFRQEAQADGVRTITASSTSFQQYLLYRHIECWESYMRANTPMVTFANSISAVMLAHAGLAPASRFAYTGFIQCATCGCM